MSSDKKRTPEHEALIAAVHEELASLWHDLYEARRRAWPEDGWSIEAERKAERIVDLSRLVGATPWEQIQVTTLLDGAYERVYRNAGIEYPSIDWSRVHAVDEQIKATGKL